MQKERIRRINVRSSQSNAFHFHPSNKQDFRRFGDTLVLYALIVAREANCRFSNAGQLLYRWGEEFDKRLRANCGNSLGITLNRWDGEFLASFLRKPGPGEYPIIPGKGSFSSRPMYDINRADLHLA
jgi:hypothetical protein